MISIHLICIGKLKEKFYLDGAAEYAKRLGAYCKLTVSEIAEEKLPSRPTPGQISAALSKEAAAIRAKIPPHAATVALCIEGRLRSSVELAQLIAGWSGGPARHLVFIIGGSYGLDPSIKEQAWMMLSMSPMTFPHHLARLMLLEQLYRSFQINGGGIYHK